MKNNGVNIQAFAVALCYCFVFWRPSVDTMVSEMYNHCSSSLMVLEF